MNEYLNFKLKYFSAAWQKVPQVSAMSSTSIAILSFTSPTRTMVATSLAFFLSLWISAKSTFSLSAMEVTLNRKIAIIFKQYYQTVKWNFAQFSAFSLFLCSLLSISKSKYIRNNYCFGCSNTSCFGHYLLAPPASGETMQLFLQSGIVSLIHFKTAGSAYKLSTGMSKKPYQNNFINQKICCMFTFKLSPVTHKIWVKVVINIQFTTEILNFKIFSWK